MALPYHPYYCEENAYKICSLLDSEQLGFRTAMLFMFGRGQWIAIHAQRAAAVGRPVFWDYHVVALVEQIHRDHNWLVMDPDSRLGLGVPVLQYLERSFPVVVPGAEPLFRPVPWTAAATGFGSNRSHMKTTDGGWKKSPPEWPMIHPERDSLFRFLNPFSTEFGKTVDLQTITGLYR